MLFGHSHCFLYVKAKCATTDRKCHTLTFGGNPLHALYASQIIVGLFHTSAPTNLINFHIKQLTLNLNPPLTKLPGYYKINCYI